MTQEQINDIKNVLAVWGADTVKFMLMRFELPIYNGRDKTKTDIYKHFHPQLISDVQSVSWVLEQPGYAENVDKGRKPGKYPTREVIGKWADARGLPNYGTMTRAKFIDVTRKIVNDRGIPPVDYLKYFTTEPYNRITDLEQKLYITIGNILENDIIKITRNIK